MSGRESLTGPEQISLYFHVPFCKKKCDYCHFYVIPDKEPYKEQYMEGLKLEWEQSKEELSGKNLCSIYFGGGTPSLLGPKRISQIISWVEESLSMNAKDLEITLEANPEEVTIDLMKEYSHAGINRVSIGVQSFDDLLLHKLSRGHDANKAQAAVNHTYEAGIHNISIDLMYDIPHQTFEQWERTLDTALDLPITHLSLYNLVFEPHTVFYKKKSLLQPFLPKEEISSNMYQAAVEKCHRAGLIQYEISAFQKPGFHSCHNIGYWLGRSFLGLGPSAFSYWNGKRYRNIANLNRYLNLLKKGESPVDFEEQLEGVNKIRELLAVNLRVIEGVDLERFQQTHGVLDAETLTAIDRLQVQGLLRNSTRHLQLTQKGILFYDTVATEII